MHTLGTRWQGSRENWLWEVETAYQFGHQSNLTRNAGMATGGIGRAFSKWWARPELWFYYDYASGTQNPGDGYATFNQLFPSATSISDTWTSSAGRTSSIPT